MYIYVNKSKTLNIYIIKLIIQCYTFNYSFIKIYYIYSYHLIYNYLIFLKEFLHYHYHLFYQINLLNSFYSVNYYDLSNQIYK